MLGKRSFKRNCALSKRNKFLIAFCLILFILFPFYGGDYFHYMADYPLLQDDRLQLNEEQVYSFIAKNTPNYHFFRLVIWGGALFLLFLLFRKLKLNVDLCFFIFSSVYITQFAYARVSLAMAIMFYGAAFLLVKSGITRGYNFITGLAIVLISIFFHKSSIIGIITLFLAYILRNINKNTIIFVLAVFPVGLLIVNIVISNYLSISFDDVVGTIGKGQDYFTADALEQGIGEIIQLTLWRLTVYLIALYYIRLIFKNKISIYPPHIKLFATSTFLIVYIASFFLFDVGINTTILFNRILNYSIIPGTVFLAYSKMHNIENNWINKILTLGVIAATYTLIYSTYLNYVNANKIFEILKMI